jgi:hypothetical protein
MLRTFLLCLVLCVTASARHRQHVHRPDTRAFAPTKASQLAQNAEIERLRLARIKNDSELREFVQAGILVPVQATGTVINPRLPQNRRYVLPWVNEVLGEIGAGYERQFNRPLIVTSAVRTEKVQRRLLHWNRNAAPVHGELASSHLTGATVDIARGRMSLAETRWMETTLMDYAVRNRVIVLEENGQRCFHIFVMPRRADGTLLSYIAKH